MIIFSYEPHSDFMAELGIWKKSSIKYKILNYLEKTAGKEAEFVLTGTQFMVDKLLKENAKGKIYRTPTGIDSSIFYPTNADKLISNHNLQNKKILLYLGKFGGLYYNREIIQLFKTLLIEIENLHFLVITPNEINEIKKYFSEEEIDKKDYTILPPIYDKNIVNKYINIADIGLNAIPPSPSQKYRSPVKVGEYLMCGKPFITCFGVSEDYLYAEQKNVGAVVKDFSLLEIEKALPKIKQLLKEDKTTLTKRCREVGIDYRSKENVTRILIDIFKQL